MPAAQTQTREDVQIESLRRLSRDLKTAAATLSAKEVRYLVDAYYQMQENRKIADNQIRAMTTSGEPHEVIGWLSSNASILERNIKSVLDAHTSGNIVGRWCKSIVGIGPVLAAGLAAHIDITHAPTVGHIWSFAGLNPTVEWNKGEKRPWNARLKTLCWLIGESFVKVSNHEDDFYGHLWRERKEEEERRNANGEYAAQAEAKLAKFKIGKDTDAYKSYSTGKLPPAHIHARAKRWAVKLFLAHFHHVAYEVHYQTQPPKPYVLTHVPGHVHEIVAPNWPMA